MDRTPSDYKKVGWNTSTPVKKKTHVGRTGRRRVQKKNKNRAIKITQNSYRRASGYKKVEPLPHTAKKLIGSDPGAWLAYELQLYSELPPKYIPEALAKASESEIRESLPPVEPGRPDPTEHDFKLSRKYSDYQGKLDEFKEDLGGAPNYAGSTPVLRPKSTFFGFSTEHVKVVVSKALRKNWFPRPLWKALASHVGIDRPHTRYEHLMLSIEAIDRIKQNLEEIQTRLLTEQKAFKFFNKATGLSFHNTLNSPQMLAVSMKDYVDLFERHFEKAEASGNLMSFLDEAMPSDNVCFEARLTSMYNYTSKYPLDGVANSFNIDSLADYDQKSSVEHALNEELRLLNAAGKLDSTENIRSCLINESKMIGKKFTGGVSQSEAFAEFMGEALEAREVVITEELLDKYLDFAENVVCYF
ncbi:MAG: hypothetical protein ACR2PT_19890 [Endozoicomonas sp.]